MESTIYIPTKGREGPLLTLENIKHLHPVLVHPGEKHDYDGPQKIIDKKYLGEVWQIILEDCPTQCCIIVDDDLRFATRYAGIAGMLEPSEPDDIKEMFEWMAVQAEEFAHGAISIRTGNNFQEGPHRDCTNAKDCLYFDRDVLLEEGVRLDRLKTIQDFDITLQLLHKGYPNRVGFLWAVDQKNPTAAGGTTLYRTPEVQTEAAYQLHKFWPDYVKVVQKKTKNKVAIYGATRTDVRIQWKKCWRERS